MRRLNPTGPAPLAALLAPLAALAALALPAARAEGVELPVDAELDTNKVTIQLRSGRIEVVLDPAEEPQLLIEDIERGAETEGFVTIERAENVLTITQPHGDESVAPRLAIRITAQPGLVLTVNGESLDVTVEGRVEANPAKAPNDAAMFDEAAIAPAAAQLRLTVDDSDVRITRASGATLGGRGSRFTVEDCSGPLIAELKSSRLAVSRHHGLVRFKGDSGDVEVAELDGALRFTMDGGTLTVNGGRGTMQGEAVSANVALEGWQGTVQLSGDSSRLEVRRSGPENALLFLRAESTDVIVEEVPGGLAAELLGGSLSAKGLAGRAKITARDGAEVELEGVKDALDLTLEDSSSAKVKAIARGTTLKLDQSSFAAEGLDAFEAKANGGKISVGGATGKVELKATDTDIDLRVLTRGMHPQLTLDGRAVARLVLPSPCLVMTEGVDESGAPPPGVSASGCEIAPKGTSRLQATRSAVRAGTTYVEAKVSDDARLAVSATP
jgi:virulence-associated protein VagC